MNNNVFKDGVTHCRYCGNSVNELNNLGYCYEEDCFTISKAKAKVATYKNRYENARLKKDSYGQVGMVVTNSYSTRHREMDSIAYDFMKEFEIPNLREAKSYLWESWMGKQYLEDWDKSIRR